jgi:hypothetical protein
MYQWFTVVDKIRDGIKRRYLLISTHDHVGTDCLARSELNDALLFVHQKLSGRSFNSAK